MKCMTWTIDVRNAQHHNVTKEKNQLNIENEIYCLYWHYYLLSCAERVDMITFTQHHQHGNILSALQWLIRQSDSKL